MESDYEMFGLGINLTPLLDLYFATYDLSNSGKIRSQGFGAIGSDAMGHDTIIVVDDNKLFFRIGGGLEHKVTGELKAQPEIQDKDFKLPERRYSLKEKEIKYNAAGDIDNERVPLFLGNNDDELYMNALVVETKGLNRFFKSFLHGYLIYRGKFTGGGTTINERLESYFDRMLPSQLDDLKDYPRIDA